MATELSQFAEAWCVAKYGNVAKSTEKKHKEIENGD